MCSSMRMKKTGAALKESRMLIVKKLGELDLPMLQTQARNSNNPLLQERTHLNFPPSKARKKQQHFIGISGSYCFPLLLPSKKAFMMTGKGMSRYLASKLDRFFFAPALSGEERVVKIAKQKFFFIFGGNISGHFKVGPVSRDTLFCPSFSGASLWETGGKGSGKKSLIRVRDAYFFFDENGGGSARNNPFDFSLLPPFFY